jgi:hypothetical protein
MNKLKKYTLVLSALIALLAVAGCDKGSIFNGEQAPTDATTRLETAGFDVRAYEFTPKTAKYMQCVFVDGGRKGGLACFEKK